MNRPGRHELLAVVKLGSGAGERSSLMSRSQRVVCIESSFFLVMFREWRFFQKKKKKRERESGVRFPIICNCKS
jgi:hypothetical protein